MARNVSSQEGASRPAASKSRAERSIARPRRVSIVKKPARGPTMRPAPSARPPHAKHVARPSTPVRRVSVVKKPARGPSRRVVARRTVERRRSPRATPAAMGGGTTASIARRATPARPAQRTATGALPPPAAPPQTAAPQPSFAIPTGYGDDRIVLLVKDPWWLHAYWEI